jgi:hypothetical protein
MDPLVWLLQKFTNFNYFFENKFAVCGAVFEDDTGGFNESNLAFFISRA